MRVRRARALSRHAGRPLRRARAAVGAALLFAVLPGPGGAAPDGNAALEARARVLEDQLIAPCCFAQTVRNHSSPVVAEIRQDLRRRLAAGEPEEAILEAYRQRYGERILASPPARGFNVFAWVVPPLAVLTGLGGGLLWLRRRAGGTAGTDPAPPPAAAHLRDRLEAELREFGA